MKTISRAEHARLVRYLLCELAERERAPLEERYFLDERYREMLDELETELADAYVAGPLTPEQRRHFESRFLVTAERKAAVQAAYLTKLYRERVAAPTVLPPAKARWNWSIVAVAAALVMVVGSPWFFLETYTAEQRLDVELPKPPGVPVLPFAPAASASESTLTRKPPDAVLLEAAPQTDRPRVRTQAGARNKPVSPSQSDESFSGPVKYRYGLGAFAQLRIPRIDPNNAAALGERIKESLLARYHLTLLTPDKKAIAMPGSILILKKGTLIMTPLWTDAPYRNIYENGQIVPNAALDEFRKWASEPGFSRRGVFTPSVVAGEAVRVISIDVRNDGVVFDLFSDADARASYAPLFFRFATVALPPVEQVEKVIAEVFDVQP